MLDPTVVADIDHQGIPGETAILEVIDQLTAGFIEPLHHGVIAGDKIGGDALGLVFLKEAVGWVVGVVGEEGGVPDEKRLLGGDGLINEREDGGHALATDGEAVVAVASAGLGKAAGHAVGESSALKAAFPPFT